MQSPRAQPVDALLLRWSRTHGPYTAGDIAARYRMPAAQVEALLGDLERRALVIAGAFRPGAARNPGAASNPDAAAREWCDPEVLRRIKQRTLARLRNQAAPVEPARMGRFLPRWHGLDQPGRGTARLEEVIAQLEGLPLPFGELERVILPARVRDFAPAMLDELGATGRLVWVGRGALGSSDGRVALYRRDHAALWLEQDPAASSGNSDDDDNSDSGDNSNNRSSAQGPLHRALLDCLRTRGASFFMVLQDACAPASADEVMAALWDLVWAGQVTNDTLQPLRALARRPATTRARRTARPASRRPRQSPLLAASGRWSLVSELGRSASASLSPTERAHARAVKLLERHGIVTREVAALESLPGGFSAIYPVLRAMEEAGKVRRGYFVHGLGGAQFAWPGAVDRLREGDDAGTPSNTDAAGDDIQLLSAVDPANPYGWLLPWPSRAEDATAPPRRVAGATIVLVGGAPVFYLERGGRGIITFPAADDARNLAAAVRALDTVAARARGKSLRIETVDGMPARTSALAETLRAAGFFADPRGLVREVR